MISRHEEQKRAVGVEYTDVWQTIFCSLAMILLTFFVMMAVWSQFEVRKMAYARLLVSRPEQTAGEAKQLIERLAQELGQEGTMTVESVTGGFKAVLAPPLLFASGKANIDPQAFPLLDHIARALQHSSLFVTVEGHTDTTPINTVEFPSNWELSTMRAVNVIRYLHNRGVAIDRLSAVGFGEFRPIADNGTEEGRRKNRRIEIVFTNKVS